MKRSLLCVVLLGGSALLAADAPNAQIDRGRQWFLHSTKGLACATCHSLEGNGNSIGPDLTRLASVVGPRGLVMTIEMTMTAYVQRVELRNGREFPGIQKQKDGDILEIYDLSKTPAVLLKVKSADVASMKGNTKWTHPPTSAGYLPNELADIIAYLKFVSTGVAKEVTVDELH
jgi:putative heme-binding domain-containing protein